MKVDSPTKELLFSTVRITNEQRNNQVSVGTGFVLHKDYSLGRSIYVLLTNKHVLADARRVTLHFIAREAGTDQPKLGTPHDVVLDGTTTEWIGHPDPDVDVAAVNISALVLAMNDRAFFRALPTNLMPGESGNEIYIDAIEELIFIGYPNGHYDSAHLTPIVRNGITATQLELPFEGKPAFLMDGSVFGGSSGSPVFLLNEGIFRSGPDSVSPGTRIALVGVVAATLSRDTLLPIVVGHGPHVRMAKELNLGLVYNWHAINQTIEALERKLGLDS